MRHAANAILIAILLGVPWLRIAGEPLILLDVPGRKFHVFGLVIFPQELFFLWLIVMGAALALFFFTALAGRLWCGWACPQTVFTDLFALIARRIEGWKGSQRPRHVGLWRKIVTHAVWLAISLIVGFHLVGYFVSPYMLIADLRAGMIHPSALGFLFTVSALAYVDFALVRQVFCKYLCPYARFQGVLFDSDTLVIGYDTTRGEPRGKRSQRPDAATRGDCVDCGLCVAVCPSEIDIRDGLQLECIACTQCIDACDGVMTRLGRARGLIDYRALVSLEGIRPAQLLRPRVLVYGAALLVAIGAFAVLLSGRSLMDLQVIRNRANLYSTAADGRIGNAFTLHIQNRDREDRRFRIGLGSGATLELVAGLNPIDVAAVSTAEARVFVLAEAGDSNSRDFEFVLEPVDNEASPIARRARFVAPGGNGAAH